MRALLLILSAAVAALAVWLWGFGGADLVAARAASGQAEAQRAMAGALRSLRAGEPGALAALCGLAFTYGVFHAAGPGHGKVLIGGYGVGRRVALLKLSGLALASSLAQAAAAVALVYGGLWLLGWGRTEMTAAAERWFAPASYIAIGLIGLYLLVRGLRRLLALSPRFAVAPVAAGAHAGGHVHPHASAHEHGHVHRAADAAGDRHGHDHDAGHAHDDHADHHHHDDGVCPSCGHRHAPTAEEAARVGSLREAAALIAAVAIRPCTGALFLLILTWRMEIAGAGILATFAMGLGTAAITVGVAIAAVAFREGAVARIAAGPGAARILAGIEAMAGSIVALLALQLLLRAV
ncbi:nickel/cobalt transporter [Roseivivax sediminis]|uniref:Nickel/cobalt efflux system n=1 Tax=Roseivivax sediminis TaxID=936889 RepID=A0A1I1SM07_9RHOB|nr:hypothetical protein [Roseivivax sediminis]SFD47509.1 ABC-type nickel/cobalt efflux system, permease component RcnA [Roseivivax sediminis]